MSPKGVPFPMASDPTGAIGKTYGVYDEAAGVNIRGRFVIGSEGIIQAMEVLTPQIGRSIAEMIRQVQAFQHIRRTSEVTPAGWHPGEPTLRPGFSLIGKAWQVWQPNTLDR